MILEIILLPRIKNECFIWNNFGVENTLSLEVFSLIKDIKKIIISKKKKRLLKLIYTKNY